MKNIIINGIDRIIPAMRIVWACQVAASLVLIASAIALYQNTPMETAPWIMGIAGAAVGFGSLITFISSYIFRSVVANH